MNLRSLLFTLSLLFWVISLKAIITSDKSGRENLIVHYSIAEPQSEYPRGLAVSHHYMVLAKPASDTISWRESDHITATYEAWPDYINPETIPDPYKKIAVHFAQVDANQPVRFRVELIDGNSIERLKLNPSRYNEIRETLESGTDWIEFEVNPSEFTKHILVEINEPLDSPVLNDGLMIFMNPLSEKPEGNILTLAEGVLLAEDLLISDDSCLHIGPDSPYDGLYIPNNTIINGRIDIRKPGFKVAGRGIICGSEWKYAKSTENWRDAYPITRNKEVVKGLFNGNYDTSVEGILVVHPYHFCFTAGLFYTNCKAFGWRYSSDGFHGKYIKGCFAKVNDDHQYTNEGTVRYSSYWGMNNGAVFQLGWGGAAIAPGGNCQVKSCNILRGEWTQDGGERQNNGVFSGVIQAQGLMKNNVFEDIRVDGQCFRFIGYQLSDDIRLKNFVFKDIWFENPLGIPKGYQKRGDPIENFLECGDIQGFVFDNVLIGGKNVKGLNDFGVVNTKNLGRTIFW